MPNVHALGPTCRAVCCIALALTLARPSPAFADDDGNDVQIGVEWVGAYAGTGAAVERDLNTSDECVEGLYRIVDDPRTGWGWKFDWGNSSAWELDFKTHRLGGNAARLADDVDLVSFCGHGTGNSLLFNNQNEDWLATPSDMDLGYRDCEWALMFTCNFLTGTPSRYAAAFNGVHLICGYATDMTVTSNGGERFAYYAMPTLLRQAYGVRVAWYKYGLATQNGSDRNIARTFGAKSAVNDYLWGYGPVSADPPHYSVSPASYTYWDTKLNW